MATPNVEIQALELKHKEEKEKLELDLKIAQDKAKKLDDENKALSAINTKYYNRLIDQDRTNNISKTKNTDNDEYSVEKLVSNMTRKSGK